MRVNPLRLTTLVFLVGLLFHASLTPSWAAGCPQSCFALSWQSPFCVSAARLDTTTSGGSCGNEAGFDIPGGTLFCVTVGAFGNCSGDEDLVDDFVVLGSPNGTPVDLRVQLAIRTSSFGGASASGSILRDSNSLAVWNHVWADMDPFSEEDTTLNAALQVSAGTPFRLHFKLHASAGGDAIRVVSQASFAFDGLGPGQRVESCQGFVQAPTAVLPATWGRVKDLYR